MSPRPDEPRWSRGDPLRPPGTRPAGGNGPTSPRAPRRRWGDAREQLTLGAALGISTATMDTPGRHVVVGEVHSVSRTTPDDRMRVAGTLTVAGCAHPIPFTGRGIAGVEVGRRVELVGWWDDRDPERGTVLRAERCAASVLPRERDGVVRYLAANVDGIGPALAGRLVDHFLARGVDPVRLLDVLEASPERVAEVDAFPAKRRDTLVTSLRAWASAVEDDRWAAKLAPRLMVAADVSYPLARRIVRHFSAADVADLIVGDAPYRLLEVPGVGWKTADAIARRLGVAPGAEERVEAGLGHTLDTAMARRGHSAVPREVLARLAGGRNAALEGVAPEAVERGIDACVRYADLVEDGDLLYRPAALRAEWDVAESLAALAQVRFPLSGDHRAVIARVCGAYKLEPDQAGAVTLTFAHGASVLTGRPGAGKTHTLKAIVAAARALGLAVRIAAPTGKAAARVTDVVREVGPGAPLRATTLHKLLGGPVGGERAEGPLANCVLVVDETSMVDLDVMAWLVRNLALHRGVRLLLVGDGDQLPSVGHGRVLADVLEAGVLPTTRLTKPQRQAADSRIVANAHALLDGRALALDPTVDFQFVELPGTPHGGPHRTSGGGPAAPARPALPRGPGPAADGADGASQAGTAAPAYLQRAQDAVLAAVRRLVRDERTSLVRAAGFDKPFDPRRDVQVLTPRNGGPLGVHALNTRLQALLNPMPAAGAPAGPRIDGGTARVGDRVICVRNDYGVGDEGLMNGEQGVVVEADAAAEYVAVSLDDGRSVGTRGVQTYLWAHAFCTTVHRAQGSEYPFVVVCCHSAHGPLVDVGLLYTAITRARARVVLAADRAGLAAIQARRGDATRRHTGLARHLREAAESAPAA